MIMTILQTIKKIMIDVSHFTILPMTDSNRIYQKLYNHNIGHRSSCPHMFGDLPSFCLVRCCLLPCNRLRFLDNLIEKLYHFVSFN